MVDLIKKCVLSELEKKLHISVVLNVGAQTLKSNIDKINREYFIEINGCYVFRIWCDTLLVLSIDHAFKYQKGPVNIGVELIKYPDVARDRLRWKSRLESRKPFRQLWLHFWDQEFRPKRMWSETKKRRFNCTYLA